MECVASASYSFTVNGEMFGYFKGKRGLRQGDPLSPLLFTLYKEYLTRTIRYATTKYGFKYHPLYKELQLANLMFADDILLFGKGEAASMMNLLRSFATFSRSSGLTASPTKSEAFFGGVQEELKHEI
ncbi:hypothetical protein vseg_019697 [Gypsophila vaccaria]